MEKEKQFLNKVLNRILSEIRMDNKENKIHFPFFSMDIDHLVIVFMGHRTGRVIEPQILFRPFVNHCRNVYGLKDEEINFLWTIFKNIVRDKLGIRY
jgi:hypothetical protein